jgi:hypothetical protein
MKFLLIFPPMKMEASLFPPMSLLYIASAIRRAGHKAEIVDLPYLLDKQPDKYGLNDTSLYDYVLSKEFDVIGYGGVSPAYFFYEGFTKYLKEKRKDTPVIVGGIVGVPLKEVWEK